MRSSGSRARPALRTSFAQALRARLDDAVERQVPELLAFLSALPPAAPFVAAGRPSAEEDLAGLGDFASTARPGLAARLRAKLGG